MNLLQKIGTYLAAGALALGVVAGAYRINEVGNNLEQGFHEARDAEREMISTAIDRIEKTREVVEFYNHRPDVQILWWNEGMTGYRIDSSQLDVMREREEKKFEDSEELRDSMTEGSGFLSFFKLAQQYRLDLDEIGELLVDGEFPDISIKNCYGFDGGYSSYLRTIPPEKQIEDYFDSQYTAERDILYLEATLEPEYWEKGLSSYSEMLYFHVKKGEDIGLYPPNNNCAGRSVVIDAPGRAEAEEILEELQELRRVEVIINGVSRTQSSTCENGWCSTSIDVGLLK